MARRAPAKKMGLGEFLGDNVAYTPEAALPSGPRMRVEGEDDRFGGGRGGFGDRRGGGDRFGDRESSRSESSSQWRGDRGGGDRFEDRRGGGDRFGDRGGDRFGSREDDGGNWRGGGGGGGDRGGSRYDRPSYEPRSEERPAHMRLNLQRRAGETGGPSSPRAGGGGLRSGGASSDDKFGSAFGSRGGGGGRFGGDREREDRFGGGGGDRFGGGGDRFGGGGDRFGGGGDRFGGGGDRFGGGGSRFGNRDDARGDDRFAGAFGGMRVSDSRSQESAAASSASAPAATDKKASAQQKREERKKKAEEERLAAEEAKRAAAEKKKAAEAAAAQQAETDRQTLQEVLASGKKGEALAAVAKDVYKKLGHPSGAVVVEAVTAAAEDVAKASANWIAPTAYGELLKVSLEGTEKANQVKALYALQVFLNAHDFPKGVLEKCFMALYSLDIVEDAAFIEYKYDVESDAPGRMKAIVQTSNWLTWLETPESGDEDEDDE
ncbi:hypothetical protein PybrP1_006200 [[Pythium] brassicae (nom. inval.)]|nr:hypothetical protein PybrP1_006200 [[Pythium] brassicae (nom. inval.)]